MSKTIQVPVTDITRTKIEIALINEFISVISQEDSEEFISRQSVIDWLDRQRDIISRG